MNIFATRRLLPLQIALWIVPIAGVILWASNQSAPTLPDSAAAGLELLAALAVYVLATLARSERWHAILHAEGIPATRADTHSLVTIGYMGNNALPARSGELLRVFLLGSRTKASRRTILGTVLVERVLDAITLGVLLVVVAWGLASHITLPHSPALLIAVGATLVLGLVVTVTVARREHLRDRVRDTLVPVLSPLRHIGTSRGAALLLLSVAVWGLEAAVYQLVGESLNLHLGLHGALSVVVFTNLCSLVPAAPGYIGTYDAAVAFSVNAIRHVSGGVVFSYIILLRFVLFVPITVVGLVLLFARYGGLRRLRAARAAAAATT